MTWVRVRSELKMGNNLDLSDRVGSKLDLNLITRLPLDYCARVETLQVLVGSNRRRPRSFMRSLEIRWSAVEWWRRQRITIREEDARRSMMRRWWGGGSDRWWGDGRASWWNLASMVRSGRVGDVASFIEVGFWRQQRRQWRGGRGDGSGGLEKLTPGQVALLDLVLVMKKKNEGDEGVVGDLELLGWGCRLVGDLEAEVVGDGGDATTWREKSRGKARSFCRRWRSLAVVREGWRWVGEDDRGRWMNNAV